MKKLNFGVGINDADYAVVQTVDGKTVICPYYLTWKAMLRRCYCAKFYEKNPTYLQCTIDPDWLYFSVFKEWMEGQDWQGKELDKDCISAGNKHYAPEECCFISHALNTLLINSTAARGEYPQGVYWHKRDRKFVARVSINGKHKHFGYFKSVDEADDAYRLAKAKRIAQFAAQQTDPRIMNGLYLHAALQHPLNNNPW